MSAYGESLALDLATVVVVKCVAIGIHVIRNSGRYSKEPQELNLRMRVQISIWEAIKTKFEDPEIRKRIREADVIVYYNVMKHLHGLLREYLERTLEAGKEKTELLQNTSTADWFRKVEETDLLGRIDEHEKRRTFKFWSELKSEVEWTVLKKGKTEGIVDGIEAWGTRLQALAANTIPVMFSEANLETIVRHVIDKTGYLPENNIKAQMIAARAGSVTSFDFELEGIKVIEEGPCRLDARRIDYRGNEGFIRPPRPGPIIDNTSITTDQERRPQLGGMERRQWAWLASEDGKEHTPVIVEFKVRPSPGMTRGPEQGTRQEGDDGNDNPEMLDRLVRTLRVAASRPNTFHVMYCEGWFEERDYFGIVYRLPPIEGQFRCESLGNIINYKEYQDLLRLDLDHRLKLARALAWTVFELHSVNWVHQSLHPDNILLFGEDVAGQVQFEWSSPYIVGFDSSRSIRDFSGPIRRRAQLTSLLYTHPDRHFDKPYARFVRIHDIYSLGVILLELGRLSSLLEDPKFKKGQASLKEAFVAEALNLPSVLGQTYKEIVLTCLNGQLVDQAHMKFLTSEFRSQVCHKLNQIRL